MKANGIGVRRRHKQPKRVHAQSVPRFLYSGILAVGSKTAASTFLVMTELASAEAE